MDVGTLVFKRDGSFSIIRWQEELTRGDQHLLPTGKVLEKMTHLDLIALVLGESVQISPNTIGPDGDTDQIHSEHRTDGRLDWCRYFISDPTLSEVKVIVLDYREYVIERRENAPTGYSLSTEIVRW